MTKRDLLLCIASAFDRGMNLGMGRRGNIISILEMVPISQLHKLLDHVVFSAFLQPHMVSFKGQKKPCQQEGYLRCVGMLSGKASQTHLGEGHSY